MGLFARGAVASLLAAATGCAGSASPPAAAPSPASRGLAPPRHTPLTRAELATTDARIALANLDSEIDALARSVDEGLADVARGATLVERLRTRGQFLGRIADYERAAGLAERLVRDHAESTDAHLARAATEATFHRFGRAAEHLARARRLGADRSRVDALQATLLQATGRYGEALVLRQALAAERPTILSLGAEATVLADMGRTGEAARRFVDAQSAFGDVSPFPLAWLYFQEGLMWMRVEDHERARTLFRAAHERLTAYAAAAGHLGEMEAELDQVERAIALLRSAAEGSDDPDPAGQLARVLAKAGRTDEGHEWRRRAAARFEELLARHPEAFADHAAEFHLAHGDAARGLAAARRNVEVRGTPWSYGLLARAALEAGDRETACRAVRGLRSFTLVAPLRAVLAEAAAACPSAAAPRP